MEPEPKLPMTARAPQNSFSPFLFQRLRLRNAETHVRAWVLSLARRKLRKFYRDRPMHRVLLLEGQSLTFLALSIARAHMFIRNCSIRRKGGNISVDLYFFNNKKFIHLPVLYKFGSIYKITPLSTQRKGWPT